MTRWTFRDALSSWLSQHGVIGSVTLTDLVEIHRVRVGWFKRIETTLPVLLVNVIAREPVSDRHQLLLEKFAEARRPAGGAPLRFTYFHE